MSEQVQVNVEEIQTPSGAPEKQPHSEMELKAIEMGWRPKDEFTGEEEEFIDASEFVRRKPLFDKIKSLSRESKETKKALKALQEHHAKIKDIEYKRAVEELKNKKKEALRNGDEDQLIQIDDQIIDLKAAEAAEKRAAIQTASQPHPSFVKWVEVNKWYAQDAEMRETADSIGIGYAKTHPHEDPDNVLKYVSDRIKKIFSEKFKNPNKDKPSPVEGPSSNASTKKQESSFQLTDEQRKAMNTFVRQGIMTKEQYIADIKKLEGVE